MSAGELAGFYTISPKMVGTGFSRLTNWTSTDDLIGQIMTRSVETMVDIKKPAGRFRHRRQLSRDGRPT